VQHKYYNRILKMPNDTSFIRELINFIDQRLAAQEQTTAVGSNPEDQSTDVGNANQSGVNPMDRDDIFVPPLQAKLEIMKKLSGIPLKDETLKQSQEQGGPTLSDEQVVAPSQAQELKKHLTIADLFGNDVTGE
jgi:hypothetical protein